MKHISNITDILFYKASTVTNNISIVEQISKSQFFNAFS